MTPTALRMLLALVVVATAARSAGADGGLVRHRERVGPWQVTVFSSPTPLRQGPVDLSVLLQDDTGASVLDASIAIVLTPAGDGPPLALPMTHAAATNKLQYAALFELPTAGAWSCLVSIEHDGVSASVQFEIDAAPALPRVLMMWPWFTLPGVLIVVFVLRERLIARRHAAGRPPPPTV